MNIPEKLKVGGTTYTVNITDKLSLGCDYAAEILYSHAEINIRPSNPERMEADFLHEMVHAILAHMGHKSHDEREVDGIAQALHMIIKDNPDLFAPAAEEPSEPSGEEKPPEGITLPPTVAQALSDTLDRVKKDIMARSTPVINIT